MLTWCLGETDFALIILLSIPHCSKRCDVLGGPFLFLYLSAYSQEVGNEYTKSIISRSLVLLTVSDYI